MSPVPASYSSLSGVKHVPGQHTPRLRRSCNSDTVNNIAVVLAYNLCPVTCDYIVWSGELGGHRQLRRRAGGR